MDDRPLTRGDCLPGGANEERPCPYAGCRYHLGIRVSEYTGKVWPTFRGLEPDEVPETCALDVADSGDHTLAEVGELMNLSRERVRQLETRASARITAAIGFDKGAGA